MKMSKVNTFFENCNAVLSVVAVGLAVMYLMFWGVINLTKVVLKYAPPPNYEYNSTPVVYDGG